MSWASPDFKLNKTVMWSNKHENNAYFHDKSGHEISLFALMYWGLSQTHSVAMYF